MPVPRSSSEEIARALAVLPQWRVEGDAIRRDYRFRDFVEAFAFMTAAALHVQQRDHHPEWTNVYDRVQVRLTTHDAGGISARDLALAAVLDELAARFPPSS